jgi:uncharacterized RDD family membrane protein YckC
MAASWGKPAEKKAPGLGDPWTEDRKFSRTLVTPEGVDIGVRIASASERAGAFVIDALIIIAVLVALTFFVAAAGFNRDDDGSGNGRQVASVIWLLGFFLLRNFYFFLFEMGGRAATPGKRVLKIRVAARNGGALGADAIFARNAMREVEVFLPVTFMLSNANSIDGWIVLAGVIWCSVFVFFPLFNRDRLRAGDVIGGTWVVQAPKRALLPDIAVRSDPRAPDGSAFAFTREQLDVYGIRELQVLEDVLRKAAPANVAAVATRIRAKIGWTKGPNEVDNTFLRAYYAAVRQHLEAKLLMGVRKADKHAR